MRVFVTGASGWIGSALVPGLIGAGHEVTGLARSDAPAAALTEAGARVHRGDLDDPGGLRGAAGASDGVIHLAFNADMVRSGDFQGAVGADRRAVEALGEALTGSGRPLVIASATVVLAPGRGASRWPAVHGLDAAHLFRRALERARGGSRLHAVGDEGVRVRAIAEVIGRHLDVPVVSVPADKASGHFGFLAGFLAADNPVSSALTRALLGWQPAHPGLIEDLDKGHYFHGRSA